MLSPHIILANGKAATINVPLIHPRERTKSMLLNSIVMEFASHNIGNYKDVEWMNELRMISLN
jgi:hypothetical protein